MRQIFLDTETTGLDALAGDRIVEIGCIEMVGRRLTGRHLHLYFNPERTVHPEAVRVHGLTDEFLSDKPRFADEAPKVLEFLSGAEVIIHNAPFDTGFLNEELKRLGQASVQSMVARVTDSLAMAREMFPGKSNSLDALCRRLEVDNTHRTLHGALLDAGLLAEVYIRLTRGQDSLVIQHHDHASETPQELQARDLTQYLLHVIDANADELAAHEVILKELDKSSSGKTVWRATETPGAVA
jgi:DNA polymerase-3 subunit epsilon